MRATLIGFAFLTAALAIPSATHAATIAELQAQLQVLLAQIAALQAQQATAAASANVATASCPTLPRNLARGMRGTDVTQLQQFLVSQNLLASDSATGFFGGLTEAAVKQFQCTRMNICSGSASSNGYGAVGPKTRAAIAAACTLPTTPTTTPLPPTPPPSPPPPVTPPVTAPPPTTPPPSNTSCTAPWGAIVLYNSSATAYQSESIAAGQSCVSQIRTCSNGVLSGTYQYASCSAAVAPPPPPPAASLCVDCVQIRIGRPLVIRGPAGDEIDSPLTELKLDNGLFRAFTANSQTYAIDGTVPWSIGGARTQIAEAGSSGSVSECGNWLTDTERVGNTLYGFFHQERACNYTHPAGVQTHKTMAIATSPDQGATWNFLGTIISSSAQPASGKTTGEGDCTVINEGDGYLYAYCLRPSDTSWDTTVSRAPVSDLSPANWKKWNGSGWDIPAQNSQGAPLGFFGPASAYWLSEKSPMLLVANKWSGGLQLAFGKNAFTFSALKEPLIPSDDDTWARPAPTDLIGYPSVFNREDVTDDITNSFFLTYMYLPPGGDFSKRYLVMHDAWISKTSVPQTPQVGVALSQWKDRSSSRLWITSGPLIEAFDHIKILGYVMTKAHPTLATVKLEECSSSWPGHTDHLITNDGTCVGEGYSRLRTAGWVYRDEQPGTSALYRCYSPSEYYHFASINAQCDGLGNMEWKLGYVLNN